MSKPLPKPEVWYCWKELNVVENCIEGQVMESARLLTPWADPMEYEFPFDFIYPTIAQALAHKLDQAPEEEWVLVRETLEPVQWGEAEPASKEEE